MAKECFFFMTKEDLLTIFQEIEKNTLLKYVYGGIYNSNIVEEYQAIKDYKNLGINVSGNHQSERFLVMERDEPLIIREVPQETGGVKYFVDEMKNNNAISFWPGGIYNENFIICGHVSTINKSSISMKLVNTIIKQIKKQSKANVGRYYVGANAMDLYNTVRFITMNVKQSAEYDLKIN